MKQFGFPKTFHLRKKADFQRVYAQRTLLRNNLFRIYYLKNDLPYSRLGLSVSKKQGKSPRRNKIKRLLREAFRLDRLNLPRGFDFVLIPCFQKGELPPLEKIRSSLASLLEKVQ